MVSLEERVLLNAAMPHHLHDPSVSAQVQLEGHQNHKSNQKVPGPTVTPIKKVSAGGFVFTNFDGPAPGTNAGAGTNQNGISNSDTSVGFTIDNNGNFHNFTVNPLKSNSATLLNINGSTTAMAFGTNSAGTVVGTDGNGNAFTLSNGKVKTFIPLGGMSATAVVGFYVGTDGQDHGFMASQGAAKKGTLTATAIADPTIPTVAGEPEGTTFVFSQILGINDHGIAVGYYGDSTTSQHGFIYNTNTGKYTFLDDPSEAFDNGVEVTQITGITNSGEITGFYSDANGVFHGFAATP